MKVKPRLRTPITYYGGKQLMLPQILPLIPEHEIYTEAFFGGGAVFFAKEPSKVEVINDLNGEVINFYRVLQMNFWKLNDLIQSTLHSRDLYHDAELIYSRPHLFDEIKRAWAFWILTNQGFSAQIVQIECNDANKVIQSRDTENAFHYVDPPYINSDQGHYSGYTREDYTALMEVLSQVQGRFLQSSYESDILEDYVNRNGWSVLKYDKPVSVGLKKTKRKVEVLVANFELKS